VKQRWLLMTEEIPLREETAIAEAPELPEKCTRQNVQTVVWKPKCLLNLIPKDRFTAEIVFQNTGHPEKTTDTKDPPRNNLGIFLDCTQSFSQASPSI
jgi:hypothetical protein